MLVPIVEGHGEVDAVPELLRRLLHEHLNVFDIQVAKPFRVKRNQVVKSGILEARVAQATMKNAYAQAVLVLLDSDDDNPRDLWMDLVQRTWTPTPLPTAVVIIEKTFECWFLGVKDSLRGVCGIRTNADPPPNPEQIRGPKGRLSSNMEGIRAYSEVDDQVRLVNRMDIRLCQDRCQSFKYLVHCVESLVAQMRTG